MEKFAFKSKSIAVHALNSIDILHQLAVGKGVQLLRMVVVKVLISLVLGANCDISWRINCKQMKK